MRLIAFEMAMMLRRRLKSPINLIVEGFVTGALLLAIGKVVPEAGADDIAKRQIMFIASILALPALQGLHRLIAEETACGTIETLFQARGGPLRAFLCRDACSFVSVAMIVPIAGAVVSVFSEMNPCDYLSYAAPVLLMRTGLTGIGLMLGSATLLFRKTAAIVNLSSIVMVTTSLGVGLGKGLLHSISVLFPHGFLAARLIQGASPMEIIPGLALISLIWIAAGLGVYNLAVGRARKYGLLIS